MCVWRKYFDPNELYKQYHTKKFALFTRMIYYEKLILNTIKLFNSELIICPINYMSSNSFTNFVYYWSISTGINIFLTMSFSWSYGNTYSLLVFIFSSLWFTSKFNESIASSRDNRLDFLNSQSEWNEVFTCWKTKFSEASQCVTIYGFIF